MTTADVEFLSTRAIRQFSGTAAEAWTSPRPGTVYRGCVHLHPDEEGGFSVQAAHLPGVISEGDTEEEALANITEAFQAVIESYVANGEKIPWEFPGLTLEPGDLERFVEVHMNA